VLERTKHADKERRIQGVGGAMADGQWTAEPGEGRVAQDKGGNGLVIGSREFKLILASDRFADRNAGAAALRGLVHQLVSKLDVKIEDQDKEEKRLTYYLDTAAGHLNRAGYAFRVRFEESKNEFKIALKHRTPDRYLAASKDVTSPKQKKGSAKFEEDILPTFHSLFSQSNSLWYGKLPKLDDLGDAAKLFPGLKVLNAPNKTKLAKVNGFDAREVFRKLCTLKFKKINKKIKVRMGLSFWYHTPADQWPLIAECAFDYQADQGDDFPLPVVEGTNQLFRALQNQPGWFNFDATTKTRYVYDGLT
jgi:hypothetical protein